MTNPPKLTEDQIDDLLYFARTGESQDLLDTLAEIKAAANVTSVEVLLAARDEHTGNNVLHMTAGSTESFL